MNDEPEGPRSRSSERRPMLLGCPLRRRYTPPTVPALPPSHDPATPRGPRVDHPEVMAAASWADQTAMLGRLRRQHVHRRTLCNSDSRTRGRGVGLASVPNSTAPWIDAAAAQPTKQSSRVFPVSVHEVV